MLSRHEEMGWIYGRLSPRLIYPSGRFGDWFAYSSDRGDYPGATTDKDFIGTAYFAHSAHLTAEATRVLGNDADHNYYEDLFQKIETALAKEFVSPNGRLSSNTQTAYTLAMAFDLLPDSLQQQASECLAADVRQHGLITTGFLGTPLICPMLTRYRYTKEAYQLLLNTKYPSWLYPITKGATTCWERWDGIKPDGTVGKQSLNHYAFGAVVACLFSDVAGICQADGSCAFNDIVIAPHPDKRLQWAKATYRSVKGTITSSWKLQGNEFILNVEIPDGCTATVIMPGKSVERKCVGAGEHAFTLKIEKTEHYAEVVYVVSGFCILVLLNDNRISTGGSGEMKRVYGKMKTLYKYGM